MKKISKKKWKVIVLVTFFAVLLIGYVRGWDLNLTNPGVASDLAPDIREFELIENPDNTKAKLVEHRWEALFEIMSGNPFKRMYQMVFEFAVTHVKFYGKVIDQNGVAVANAKVSYLIVGQFPSAGAGRGFTITDDQGRFYIKGKGNSVTVQAIKHPQINFNPPATERERKLVTLYEGENPGLIIRNWNVYTKNNPYIFKTWMEKKFENVKGASGYGDSLIPDGRVYTYDFLQFRNWRKRVSEGETQGHLRVSCERAVMQGLRDYQDWQITLAPVNGGIQATDDIYQNLAPETGYLPSIIVEQKLDSSDYQHLILNQRYYFTTDDGATYGSLVVHYYPHTEKGCKAAVAFKMNLEGSRNLAVKE